MKLYQSSTIFPFISLHKDYRLQPFETKLRFSHQLELALKNALKEFIEPEDTSLMHLFYLYKKSSKKHQELKICSHLLEGQFEMYSAGVRPLKATGTRWIDHNIAAMGARH